MKHLIFLFFLSSFVFSQHTQKDPNTGVISKYSSNGNILERYTLDSNGKYHGKREEWYKTRNYYDDPVKYCIENWKHGRPYGKQTYWHENGQLDMIVYKDDDARAERYGEFVRYYENGQKRFYEIRDRKGRLIGADKEWNEDGFILEHFNYKDGKKHGFQKKWNEDGFILEHFNYKDGKKHGDQKEWEFEPGMYDEHILIKHFKYENGKKHGEQKYYSSEFAGSLSKIQNYKYGDKHGVFQEIDRYGNINSQESWYEGKKHGKWFLHGYEGGSPEYEHNYRYGKKHGVWIEYQEVYVDGYEGDEGVLEFIGIKEIQTWKDGKLNGITKRWGDNCFKDENIVMYPKIPAYNLILEENYKNGKKEGIEKKWNSGHYEINSDGEAIWVEGQLISEQTYKEGKLFGPYRLLWGDDSYEEGIYSNYERKPKKRKYNGWYTMNYDGLYLDYQKFQQEDRIEYLDSLISKLENILKYENSKNYLLEKQIINKSIIQDNLSQIDVLSNKKDSLEKFLTYFKNEKTGANKLQKIIDKQNGNKKLNKKEIKILNQIQSLNNNIFSTSVDVQTIKNNTLDLNKTIKNDSVLINYYNSFLIDNKINNYLQLFNSEKELELSKIIYDTSVVYSKDYYTNKRVKEFDSDDNYGLNISLLVSKNNIGPFYLGMSEDDIFSFLNSDEYFSAFNSINLNKHNDFETCVIPCDVDIDTVLYKENLNFEEWLKEKWEYEDAGLNEDEYRDIFEEEGPFSSSTKKWDRHMVKYEDGDKVIILQYEIAGSKRLDKDEDDPEPNWHDLQINFFLTNDTIHTISLEQRRGEHDQTYRDNFYSTKNGIFYLKPFDTFTSEQLESCSFYKFIDQGSDPKFQSIYANNLDVSLFLNYDLNVDWNEKKQTYTLIVDRFKITNRNDFEKKYLEKIKKNEIKPFFSEKMEEKSPVDENGY